SRGVHEIVRIPENPAPRILAIDGSRRVYVCAVTDGHVTAPIAIRTGHFRPGVRCKIEYRATVGSPTVSMEGNLEPRRSSAARNVVDTDRLAAGGCRPIRIAGNNAVDRLI